MAKCGMTAFCKCSTLSGLTKNKTTHTQKTSTLMNIGPKRVRKQKNSSHPLQLYSTDKYHCQSPYPVILKSLKDNNEEKNGLCLLFQFSNKSFTNIKCLSYKELNKSTTNLPSKIYCKTYNKFFFIGMVSHLSNNVNKLNLLLMTKKVTVAVH